MKPVIYEKRGGAEIVRYECAAQSYPAHTHAGHVTFGRVTGGAVRVIIGGRARLCRAGDVFCIPPDVPHALEAVGGSPYSMTVACVPVREKPCDGGEPFTRTLKRLILGGPERPLTIGCMAKSAGISPYHLIRRFKADCGLTPHQFQMQCRVRKAQGLLAEGRSATEAAYEAGFCDQSHLDRCFRRIVRLTPSEYAASTAVCPSAGPE